MRDMLERYSRSDAEFSVGLMILRRTVALMFGLFIGAIFSTIGGLVGAMIFKKDTPPGVIDIPPAS
jgi:hypothetical protein